MPHFEEILTEQNLTKPFLIKNAFSDSFINNEILFQAIKQANQRQVKGESNIKLTFYNGLQAQATQYWHRPNDDKNLNEYLSRLEQIIIKSTSNTKTYALKFHDIHKYCDFSFWIKLKKLCQNYFKQRGFSAYVENVLFIGNYASTPIGIHKDSGSVFKFVIQGTKKIRLWEPDYFKLKNHKPNIHNYQEHLDQSILLEGNPGDIIYWPKNYWHIGENNSQTSISLSLAFYEKSKIALFNELIDFSRNKIHRKNANVSLLKNNPDFIESYGTDFDEYLSKTYNYDAMRLFITQKWLETYTASGFMHIPQKLNFILDEQEHLNTSPHFPIYYKQIGHELILACHGRSFNITNPTKEILDLIEFINSKTKFTYLGLSNKFQTIPKSVLKFMIQTLGSYGAFYAKF